MRAMPISHHNFASKMTRALRKAGVAGDLRYDAERFAIVSDQHGEFFLASAHQQYTEASFWKRGRVLTHYAQVMFNVPKSELPKSFDEARGNLVPVVRNTAYLDVAELLARTSSRASEVPERAPARFEPLAGT